MSKISIGALDETQIVAAGQTLTKAFLDDPLQIHVFPDAEERARRSPPQFAALVRQASLFGEVIAAEDMTGISLWMPPGAVITAENASRSGMQKLPEAMGRDAFLRFGMALDYLSGAHANGLPAKHWYLMAVGVLPERQGRGQGRALLQPIIARADAAGMPICLDTAQPKVKSLYQALGFRVTVETVDPKSGLRFWTYQRDPG
jgi:GNAT superfamily N-acetyltransferase